MAQTLRPDSNVTRSNITGSYTDIWEETADDTDYVYGAISTAAVLEVGLGNPGATPASGTTTVRYRVAKVLDTAEVTDFGDAITATCEIYEGAVLVEADSARTLTGTWTQYSFTPDMSGVSDWNDLRLRFTQSVGNRAMGISWAELEAPDEVSSVTGALQKAIGAVTLSATGIATTSADLDATLGAVTLTARGGGPITYASLNATLQPATLSATARAHGLFQKDAKPPLVEVEPDDLPVGIFDPAIFDPAIFDTGTTPVFTKAAKPPSVET